MKTFGFSGHSGSGKTTLILKLLPLLQARGLKVSTIKQANAAFDIDCPGKDSYEHRTAGAREVLVASARRWALMHEYRGEPEYTMEQLLARMTPVDLVLVEGFRQWPHPRIEVWREELGRSPLWSDDPRVVALAGTIPLKTCTLPFLPLDDPEMIVAFVMETLEA